MYLICIFGDIHDRNQSPKPLVDPSATIDRTAIREMFRRLVAKFYTVYKSCTCATLKENLKADYIVTVILFNIVSHFERFGTIRSLPERAFLTTYAANGLDYKRNLWTEEEVETRFLQETVVGLRN